MPLLDDVRPTQVYERKGSLFEIVSVCNEPTATARNMFDPDEEVGGAQRCLLFADFKFVDPADVPLRKFECRMARTCNPIGKIVGFIVCEETGQLRLRTKPANVSAAQQWMGASLRGEKVGFFAAGREWWSAVYLVSSVSGNPDDSSLVDVILEDRADPDVSYKTLRPRSLFINTDSPFRNPT